jgi:hypothetical protein
MSGPDSISDLVARRLRCTESSLSAQLGSARLNSARLSSARVWWHGRWVPHCWRVWWLDDDMAWWRHDYVILIRVWNVGRINWYSGQVSPSGRRRRVARVCARGQSLCWCVMARAEVSGVQFRRGFQQWLHLFLFYTVVWSKHNFDNFHFWAKSNIPLNHVLWYQLLGNSSTPCADRGCTDSCLEKRKHTDTIVYVVRQIAYIHGRESILLSSINNAT